MEGASAKPLILTAELTRADMDWFDGLRRRHFPPERNRLAAHLTMFHALPPSLEAELLRLLPSLTRQAALSALIDAPYSLGRGVAFRVRSPDLEALREGLACQFHGCLTAQDRQGWRGHVTVQNKVDPSRAKATLANLAEGYSPRTSKVVALQLHRYAGGPWEPLRRFAFRG